MSLFTEVFGQTRQVGPWQECARAVVVFAYGLVMVRLAGRRVFGKWAALDIIVSIIVGSSLSRTLTGSAPLAGTLLATTLLMGLHWALAHAAARSARVSHAVEGRPSALVRAGELLHAAVRRYGVSEADLAEALRQNGLQEVGQAEAMTLEPSGKITVKPRA